MFLVVVPNNFFPNIVTTLCNMCQLVLLPHFFFLNVAYCSISLHLLSLHNALSPSTSLLLNYSLLFSFHLLHCSSIVHSSIFSFYYFCFVFISILFISSIHCWFYLFSLTFFTTFGLIFFKLCVSSLHIALFNILAFFACLGFW